jgi:hypothetical protein
MGFAVLAVAQPVEKSSLAGFLEISAERYAVQPHPHPSPSLEGEGAKPARFMRCRWRVSAMEN